MSARHRRPSSLIARFRTALVPVIAVTAIVAASATPGLPSTAAARPAKPAHTTLAPVSGANAKTVASVSGLPSACTASSDGTQVSCSWGGNVSTTLAVPIGAYGISYTASGAGAATPSNSGAAGAGSILNGYLGDGVAGTTLQIGTGQQGGNNPNTTYGNFSGGGAGSEAGGGHDGDHGGAATIIGSGSSLLVVAGGGGGGGGNYGGSAGGRGGDGSTGGGNGTSTAGGGGGSRSSSSLQYGGGGGGGGGGYYAGNGGGASNGSSGGGGQGGNDAVFGSASKSRLGGNAGDGSVTITYNRTLPGMSVSSQSAAIYAYQSQATISFSVGSQVGTPTGTVSVGDGGRQICSVNLGVGYGSCSLSGSQLTAGVHYLEVFYSGDAGFQSTSVTVPYTVSPNPVTTTLAANPQPDGTYQLVATATPTNSDGIVDGTVSLQATGSSVLNSCPTNTTQTLSDSNVANRRGAPVSTTCVLPLAPGSYSVNAVFTGTSNSASGSQQQTVTIAQYVPVVRLSMTPTSLDHYGATTVATVAVSAPINALSDPDGSVTVAPNSGKGGSCTTSAGTTVNHVTTYTCTLTPAGGDQDYVATYGGNSSYQSTASTAVTVSTVSTVPTLTLVPRLTTLPVGQTLTLDTAVTAPDGTAVSEGTVTVYDGPVAQDKSNAVASVSLSANPGGSSVTITPNAGTHVYYAQYTDDAGSTNYAVVTVQADAVYVQPLEAHLNVDVSADPTQATSAGIPTTVTATLSVPTQDQLTQPITLSPAPATPCTRSESTSNGKRYITATCAYVRAPGATPSFTATYTDDLVATVADTENTYRIPASPTATVATTTDVQYGDEPQLGATVTPVVTGAAVSGTVAFAEGGTTLCSAPVGGGTAASCQPITAPSAGSHDITATYTPDSSAAAFSSSSTSPSATFDVAQAPVSLSLSTSQSATKLTVTASASVDSGTPVVPTGKVEFADYVASCGEVALVNGIATCVVDLPDAGTRSKLTATYEPSANFTEGSKPDVSLQYQRPVSGPCSGGFAVLWLAAQAASGHGPLTVDAGALGSVKLTVDPNIGSCDAAGTLGANADVSLFAGTLKASSVRVSVDQTAGLCLASGSLSLPSIWKSGALTITQAVCFPLTSSGGISRPVGGTLALTNSGGSGAPLVSIPGVTAPASLTATLGTACPGKDIGAGTCDASALVPAVTVVARVAPASTTVPGVTVTATVGTDGSIAGAVSTTALSVLGASVQLAGTVSRTGTGTLSASVSATLAADASPAPGLTLLSGGTLTLSGGTGSAPTLAVAGTVRVAGGTSSQVDVAVSGSVSSPSSYHLSLASSSPAPSWTPISGLTLSPVLSGTLDRSGGSTTFALSATGSGGSPLATWAAPGGVTLTVGGVSLGGDPTATDLNCPYTSGLVLAMSGSMSVGGLSVDATGCVSLGDKSWHVGATARTSSVGGLSLTNLVLNAVHPAGGVTSVTGSATATLTVGTFSGSTTVTMSSDDTGFVIGGRIDATSLGLPSSSVYLAYASAARAGWQTGLPKVGLNGVVDLPAGVSLYGSMTLPTGVATVLRKAGFSLPSDATVTFEATVPPGAIGLTFTAQLATPSGFPLLTLPGGATVTAVSIVYSSGTFGLTADGTVKGQDGSAAPVHLAVTISSDGSFTGSGTVTGLSLFGRTLTLSGAVSRTAAGVFSANLTASLAGQITLGDAVLHDVTVSIGTSGLTASGSVDVANTTLAFTAAFASTTSYSLSVSTTITNWAPAPGVTVNAVITGSLTRSASGYSYDFTALPVSGASGLLTITPTTGVSLALTSFELSNGADLPVGCSVSTVGDTWLSVSGSLALSLGSSGGSGAGTGCFDLTHPSFSMTVQVPSASFGGGKVTFSNIAVTLGRTSAGFTAGATARLTVQMPSGGQFSILAIMTLGPNGFAIGGKADLSSFLGGSAAQAYLFYANTSISVDTGDPTLGILKLKPGVTAGLKFTVGSDVASALKTIGIPIGTGSSLAATALLDLNNATVVLNVALAFQSTNLISTSNGTYLRLDSLALAMTLSPTQPSFGFQVAGTLHVPASIPGGAPSDVGLSGGIRIGTELSAYLSVSNWNNAFGLAGLNLQSFTLQGGITLTGLPLPSLAVQATVDGLPSNIANVIGYQQGAPMTIALAIGETNMLLDVAIGTKDSNTVALAPFSAFGKASLLTVNYAELYLSPTGATIGDQVYPPGFSIAFQGNIVGVSVDVFAKVDPVNLSLYFRGTVGTISLGSLIIGPTTLTIDAAPTRFNLSFSGHLAIGPSVTQIGPALRLGGYLSADATFSIGTDGVSANMNFDASVYSSDYLPRSMCLAAGFVYYPCNWGWVDTPPLTIHANNIGFAINSSGFTVNVPNTSSSITFPWPTSALSLNTRSLTGRAPVVQAIDLAKAGGLAPVHNAQPRPAAGLPTWHSTGSLGAARIVAGGLALRNGSVLVAGGSGSAGRPLASAEVYDPKTGGWTQTGAMHTARVNPTMIELRDGRVLVVGGNTGSGETATAEIYDPSTHRWSRAGSMSQGRQSASAALLPDGSVLVAGGHIAGTPVTTVDRFFPQTGRWQSVAALPAPRAVAATATLADGSVLLIGGMGSTGPLQSVERFDPASSTWHAAAPMANARFFASATRLSTGKVLVAGGAAAAELYDPTTNRWSRAGSLSGPTLMSTMTTLPDGDVLVAGGLTSKGSLTQVDRYHPATNHWTAQVSLPSGRAGSIAAVLGNGRVLIAGGLTGAQADGHAFLYTADAASVPSAPYRAITPKLQVAGSDSGLGTWMWILLGGGLVLLFVAMLFLIARRQAEREPAA